MIGVPVEVWEKLRKIREVENLPFYEVINQLLLNSPLRTYVEGPQTPRGSPGFRVTVKRRTKRWERRIRVYAKGGADWMAGCSPENPCYSISASARGGLHRLVLRVECPRVAGARYARVLGTAFVSSTDVDPELYRGMVLEALRTLLKICENEGCREVTYEGYTSWLAKYVPLLNARATSRGS